MANSESIYPKLETTTSPSTTTTSTEKIDEKKEVEEKSAAVVTSDGVTKKKKSLVLELEGFLMLISKFTNTEDLPEDPACHKTEYSKCFDYNRIQQQYALTCKTSEQDKCTEYNVCRCVQNFRIRTVSKVSLTKI